jgi:hypothetical protein
LTQLDAELLASDGGPGGTDADAAVQPRAASRFKGVCWNAGMRKWHAKWWRNPGTHKKVQSGFFAVKKDAALWYDAMVRKHGGKCVNFPDKCKGETQAHAGDMPLRPLAASGFRGVFAKGGRFRARIRVDGRETDLGAFSTAEEAARAHDCRARELGWPAARFNFAHETNVQAPAPLQPGHRGGKPVGASGFRGVSLVDGKHVAKIWAGGRKQHLGAFETAEEAARAYDAAALKMRKPAHLLNFPHETHVRAPVPLPPVSRPHGPVGASGFRGVSFLHGKHVAKICTRGRVHNLGAFDTAQKAARAYDIAARKAGKPAEWLNFCDDTAHDTHIGAAAGGGAMAPDDAAEPQSRKRMRMAAGVDAAALREQLVARLAALERALSDAKAAEVVSAARASTLQAELAASQAHATELRACGDALHEKNELKRAHAERTEAATAATVEALERETRCRVCLDARRDSTLFFTCGHPLCAGCGAQLEECPSCPERCKRRPPLRLY